MLPRFYYFKSRIYTHLKSKGFKSFGKKSSIRPRADLIIGEQYISVGNNTIIGRHIQLTAWANTESAPTIQIGSNCQLGSYNHITAINSILIGNGVLTGKFVTITDNSHGNTADSSEFRVSPIKRRVFSKGPVVIGNNVWIGDKVTILPNVRIGESSIIGANSVVTKDIPPFSIVAGNPARIIKQVKYNE